MLSAARASRKKLLIEISKAKPILTVSYRHGFPLLHVGHTHLLQVLVSCLNCQGSMIVESDNSGLDHSHFILDLSSFQTLLTSICCLQFRSYFIR